MRPDETHRLSLGNSNDNAPVVAVAAVSFKVETCFIVCLRKSGKAIHVWFSLSLVRSFLSFFVFIVKQKTNMAFLFFWKREKLLFVYVSSSGGEQSLHIIPFSLSLSNVQYIQYICIYIFYTYIHTCIGLTCNQYASARQGISFSRNPEEVSPPTHCIQPTPECQHTFPVSYFFSTY